MPPLADIPSPQKILVIRRDNIGDLVCTTPLLAALRARFPAAWIGVLANSYNAPVLAGSPDVDAVFAYTKGKHLAAAGERLAALWRRAKLVLDLRRMRIDVVLLPGGAQASAQRFARLVAPRRLLVSPPDVTGHEVERSFAAARKLGVGGTPPACKVVADAARRAAIAARLPQTLAGRRLVALQLSARKPRQRWPPERFAALARALHAASGCGLLVFWSPGAEDDPLHPGDDATAAALALQTQDLPLAAVATRELADLVAGLSLCDTVICADGGAMHIAAALGKPVVCLFGNSDAARWHPWAVPCELLQPASRDVADISVDEVFAAHERLMQRTGAT
ncbi:MAG: glycosyl transferase family 9 [Betaproteobacteria bacterium HGW-Betaproteobacteria-11]|nr:MAG: glycosyl transferase family 9 [Betaproteobacteria bacterium HGW-Betaproteobacteria-11]